MTKETRYRLLLIILFAMLIPLLSIVLTIINLHLPVNIEITLLRHRIRQEQHIIHAGGYLQTQDGHLVNYTNSYDALTNMYEAGNRICEIDIRESSDGVLICAHGDSVYLAQGSELSVSASSSEFMAEKLFGEFQPMNIQDLTEFMRNHKDLIIITDVKDDNIGICRRIANEYPDLKDQFIIQIYHFSEYQAIREAGFSYIIFTAYLADSNERGLWNMAQFSSSHELVGFTVERRYFTNDSILRCAHIITGVPFMLHTVNDYSEIGHLLRSRLAIAVYTDQTVFPDI